MALCNAIKIILLDDEEAFRCSLSELLRDDGHEVRDFPSPRNVPALANLIDAEDRALVVTDYDMPGESGIEFADAVHHAYPRVPVVLVTAYRTRMLESQVARRGSFVTMVEKPIDYAELHRVIHERACSDASSSPARMPK